MLVGPAAVLGLVLFLQASEKESEEACARFRDCYRASTSPVARATAVAELSRTVHEKTLARLLPLIASEEREVRGAAIRGLGEFGSYRKSLVPALVAALTAGRREQETRASIFETLGRLADPASLRTVHAHFRDEDVRVAQSAIACAGALRQKESLDPLIDLLRDLQRWIKSKHCGPYRGEQGQKGDPEAGVARLQLIQAQILTALKAITLEPWPTAPEWEIWWGRRRTTFEVPPKPRSEAP